MPSNTNLESPLVRKRLSRRTKVKIIVVGVVLAALLVYLICDAAWRGPLTSLLLNRDQLVASMEALGLFAPLLYILLQVLQTVVAPIPGNVAGFVGGSLFGIWGILWTLIGSAIGYFIVFKLARYFGRPLLEKVFKKSVISKFDFIINSKSTSLILFAIFLLPGFPDDVVCYIAGLTNLSIRRLMAIVILGRLPTIILTNYIGAGISNNIAMVVTVSIIAVIVFGVALWQRERVMKFLKKTAGVEQKDGSAE